MNSTLWANSNSKRKTFNYPTFECFLCSHGLKEYIVLNFLYIVASTPKCCYKGTKNDKKNTFSYALTIYYTTCHLKITGRSLLQNCTCSSRVVNIFYFYQIVYKQYGDSISYGYQNLISTYFLIFTRLYLLLGSNQDLSHFYLSHAKNSLSVQTTT